MINSLLRYKQPRLWLTLHIALGIVSTISPLPVIIYFYLFLASSLSYIFKREVVNSRLSVLIIYLSSFELISRMAQTSPFIPYELGKYLMFFLLSIGVINGSNKGTIGAFLTILLTPALFYDISGKVIESDLRFNLLGPINVGLAVWYFYQQKVSPIFFKKILYALLLPLVSVLAFTVIKTPSFNEIDFSLGASFDTTGGFGSNQVATVLGLGVLISFFLWLNQWSISGNKIIDIILILAFTFQGLLSFSRGGMIGGLLGILIILFFMRRSSLQNASRKILLKARQYIMPAILILMVSAYAANEVTDGKLLLRYQGETTGTLRGNKQKDLNLLTTGRLGIFEEDWELFSANWFGVGAGASKYLRKEHQGVLTHVELGRLAAEHGVLGMIYFITLIYLILDVYKSHNNNLYKGILISFLVVAIYTTFHAATRTYVTPLLIGLSLITIVNDKNTLFRKQIRKV